MNPEKKPLWFFSFKKTRTHPLKTAPRR